MRQLDMPCRLSRRYIEKNRRYIVAVSGGMDSMVLLHLLREEISSENLIVAHFNHNTRGADSDADAAFVRSYCEDEGMEYVIGVRQSKDTLLEKGNRSAPGKASAFGESKSPSKVSEEMLRNERMAFLESARKQFQCAAIIFAHHLDDQIETLFLRLLRGTGARGLSGMREKNGYRLRPLLNVTKKEIQEFAYENLIAHCEDASNAEPTYLRNRIRHELLPVFESLSKSYGGIEKTKRRIGAMMKQVAQEEESLTKSAEDSLKKLCTETPFWLRFSRKGFKKLPRKIKNRFLLTLVKRAGVTTFGRKDVKAFRAFIKNSGKEIHLHGKLTAQISLGYVYLFSPHQRAACNRLMASTSRKVGQMREIHYPELGIRLRIPEKAGTEVRFFRPGDRVQGRKLKEVFLERRIPRPERIFVPLLAKKNSSTILWCFPEKHEMIQSIECAFPFAEKNI